MYLRYPNNTHLLVCVNESPLGNPSQVLVGVYCAARKCTNISDFLQVTQFLEKTTQIQLYHFAQFCFYYMKQEKLYNHKVYLLHPSAIPTRPQSSCLLLVRFRNRTAEEGDGEISLCDQHDILVPSHFSAIFD